VYVRVTRLALLFYFARLILVSDGRMEPLHEWVELPFSKQNVLMENLHIDVVWLERRMA
jgi:hypothetical protein